MSDEQGPPDKIGELNRELRVTFMIGSIPFFEKSEEATIKSVENAIRLILLINGGAAVSVLAFVGSLASKDRVPADQLYEIAGTLV